MNRREMMSVGFAGEFNLQIFDQILHQFAALAPRILMGFISTRLPH